MKKSCFSCVMLALIAAAVSSPLLLAWANAVFHVDAGIVVVSFTVRDKHGNYVDGLRQSQICVREDGVEQRTTSFLESLSGDGPGTAEASAGSLSGMPSSVFILFDTSNCMYERFARAEDNIENFIRHLDPSQSVAVYSFSHNMSRLARLTTDHEAAIRGLRSASAGDSTAVLNATLLGLRDAAQVPGRKVLVVFSNGPDDSSVVNPDDVARVAEEEGIPVYIIATKVSNNASENAFSVLADSSGGKLFLAPNQPSQMQAFRSITEDIKHTYTLTYRSSATGISGWRHIQLEVLGDDAKDFKVTSRTGYWANHQLGD